MARRASVVILLIALAASPLAAAEVDAAEPAGSLDGTVFTRMKPLPAVTVYAYELAELTMKKVATGPQGEFSFASLPAGVYKLIAHKVGFEPAVVMLSRAAVDARQFVELSLAAQQPADIRSAETYWSARAEIPPDVLRDIQTSELEQLAAVPPSRVEIDQFSASVQATTGFEELAQYGESQLTGGGIGVEGRIGGIELGVTGQHWRLAGETTVVDASGPEGRATTLALRMRGRGSGEIGMTSISQRGGANSTSFGADLADFENYRVSWSQPFGDRASSSFAAQYTEQSNFYRQGSLAPADIPLASRTLAVEGAYQLDISDHAFVETGLRYWQGEQTYQTAGADFAESRTLDLFGRAGWRPQPSVLVEYGLSTRMQDGSFALAPQGTVVVQVTPSLQSVATVSQRVEDGERALVAPYRPVRYSQAGNGCQDLDQHCYRVLLAHENDRQERIAIGVVHRELAETLQLYFNDNFFNHLENLYLVRGDEIPELQVVVERKLSPRILARLESSYAEGGGGILYATDDNPYENRVRYLVTSVDTTFQRSSTGIFVAFHHLEQELEPLASAEGTEPTIAPDEAKALERVQLMLSQDLNALLSVAADWALHVNFELSRGSLPFTLVDPEDEDSLRHRVTGGLSVRF